MQVGKRNRHVVTIDSFEDVPPNNEVALMKVQIRVLFQHEHACTENEFPPWCCIPIELACMHACMHSYHDGLQQRPF